MKQLFVLLLGFFSVNSATGQTAFVTAGGDHQSAAGSLSWSMGQIAVQQHSNNTGTVNEGVQQPYESLTVAVPDGPMVDGHWRLYPNPTRTGVQVESSSWLPEQATIILSHADGRSSSVSFLTSSKGWIDLSTVAAGVYVLQVRVEEHIVLYERIIKY